MATAIKSNRCSTCQKSGAQCICRGCQNFFCIKHFDDHRQQLSMQFDREIVGAHDALLEQIDQVKQSNGSHADLFSQIDQWETTTIEKVHQTAERVRQQLIPLLNQEKEILAEQYETLAKEIRSCRQEDDCTEDDVERLREKINQLQLSLGQFTQSNKAKVIVVTNDQIDWNHLIYAEKQQQMVRSLPNISLTTTWTLNGLTVAGGYGAGNALDQLSFPWGLHVDDDQTIYIADYLNHRIVEWKRGATSGQVVAGGNGLGNRTDQLNRPSDVIVDKETDNIIICDRGNRRLMRWSRRSRTNSETIISDIDGWGLAMDDKRFLYVSDSEKNEVRRYRMGDMDGTVVAGGNGEGDRLNQLNHPNYVFVDRDYSVYVSDNNNHRVMKWVKGAKAGIVVAGGRGQGSGLTQLSNPRGVFVDPLGTVYVADWGNHRVMRWCKGVTQGTVMVRGNDKGKQANQLHCPMGLSFDRDGNLYVVDNENHRVQRWNIETS